MMRHLPALMIKQFEHLFQKDPRMEKAREVA